MDEAIVQETVDYIAIRRLQASYADIVTRRAWSELSAIFLPDAPVVVDRRTAPPLELVGPAAVGEFIDEQIARFDFFEFVILNTVVDVAHEGDIDTAAARMYIWELRHDAAEGRWTNSYGLYQDRYRRVDDRWWFERRDYQSLARTARDYDVFPFPHTLEFELPT
jgi:SnoaL-like domain